MAEALERLGVRFEKVDVDANAQQRERYGTRVPVLARPDGEVLAEGRVADADLRTRLGLE